MDIMSALRQVTNTIRKWVDDNKVDKISGKGLSTHDYTTEEKNKLSGIASGAEVNQNAFSSIVVGSDAIAAGSKTDTLTIVAGDNIILTPDMPNGKITIAAVDGTYTHPSYTARTGVPAADVTLAFGETFSVSQPVSDALGHITEINNRTIMMPSATVTTSNNGLMSSTDKSKLDSIEAEANKTVVDSALSSTSTNPIQNKAVDAAISKLNTLMDTTDEAIDKLNTLVGTTDVVTQIDDALNARVGTTDVATQISNAVSSKQDTITGAATTIVDNNLTSDRVLVSDVNGKITVSDITSAEVNYLDGVTSNVQIQLNAKAASSHIHVPTEVGIIYSETEPEGVPGRIWLKPI